jgi:tetratricopeptide (TPR) repeat protein
MVEAQVPQSAGEPQLAVPMYRKAILRFMRERQPALTASLFTVFASFAMTIGEEQAGLEFAKQQKLRQSEIAVALLQAALGQGSAADEALARFSTADQGFPTNIEAERALEQAILGLRHGDRENLARALPQLVASRHIPFSFVLFIRGRAALALHDYASAERDLLLAIRQVREIRNSVGIRRRMPVIEQLCRFYLGQMYEATNRREDAIGQYQRFLSPYAKSRSRLPQIGQARSALKRLSSPSMSSLAPVTWAIRK